MEKADSENKEIFDAAEEAYGLCALLLKEFNSKKIKLSKLSPHKRIFLFFFTRAMKTYSAVRILCTNGYGQDASTLLRSLLENLISVKYILYGPGTADQKTVRFVDYKWVIFKRYLSEDKHGFGKDLGEDIPLNKTMIIGKVDEYKKKYKISSDKGLITWSGKPLRDMARLVNEALLEEYEFVFRHCSRFSHPSIIGDKEYLNYKNSTLTLSSLPTTIGAVSNLKKAILYLLDFLKMGNILFGLSYEGKIRDFESRIEDMKFPSTEKSTPDISPKNISEAVVQCGLPL